MFDDGNVLPEFLYANMNGAKLNSSESQKHVMSGKVEFA
jgi:hypothetical protein